MMVSSVIIPQILLLILVIKNTAGKAIPASSPRLKQGCDKTCQTECLEVLNEYRANHDAPKLQFSETLADKAQKWADGGKFGYDMEARGKYGQLIEWDVKDELTTFKSVIKHWHDKERDYDFEKGKSKNGKTLHDFTQVVWKKAHKAGCGRGKMYGSRYYVVWMDADGVISPNISDGSENVGPPKREDIHWFEVTKIKAVGEPLYWNATNSTKPTTGDPKLRTKSSILPTDEEELNSIENEQHILNDANNIKEYVHDSLSKVFDQENLEVAKLRDEFERIDGDSNAHFESPSQNIYGSNDETAMNSAYGDNEESSSKEMRPGIGTFKLSDKVTNQPSNEEEQYSEEHGVGQKTTYSKGDENLGSLTQPQVPMGKLPVTVDVGTTKLTESMPTTVVHEELNISDANTAGKAKKNEHKVSSESRQVQNNSAGKRQKSESMSSQEDVREMAGVIMGCTDNGERCPLWQKKGYCNSVLYTGFMKQHCKSTCGYCALPTIELQSERAKVIRYAYGEQVCNDSPNYEFSCPEWRVQGYCQKKEKEMRKFCSNTCNFCKRKKITKTKEEEKKKEDKKKEDKKKEDKKKEDEKKEDEKEERVHDQPAKTGTSAKPDSTAHAQIGSASGQLQNYAHAQNGQGQNSAQAQAGNSAQAQAGNLGGQQPSYAHAQVGNASNPQSTAYAQGGSTYVQTQSSSSQQTGYAVAQAAATPEQQTYANAQSSSPSGQPSSAYAQNTPSSKNQSSSSTAHVQTGSPESPQNVAHAQTSPANDNAKKPSGKKKNGDGTVVETPHSRLHDMTLEEKVMSESPEYRTATSDYFIQTGDSEEGIDSESNLYDEAPTIHFSNTNADGPTNRDAKLQGILEPGLRRNTENDQGSNNIGRFLDDAELKAGFSKDDLKDMEAKDTEDEKVRTLMNRFDSDMGEEYNDVTKEGSIITAKRSDKKGTLASVSTEGCDQSCQRECLDAINSYRRNHKARPLVLDQDLATHAQGWADRKAYGHSPWAQQGMGGELIAVGSFYKTFTAAVKAWHDEVKDFDWTKGKLKKGSEIKHFKQLISKDAHVVGCGKSSVNGEPYYIAQMDTGINDDDTDNTGQEKRKLMEKPEIPDLGWYMNSSPYWKDLQARGSIPKKVHRNLL